MEVVCNSDVVHRGFIKPVCNMHGKSHVVCYNVHRLNAISQVQTKHSDRDKNKVV